MVQTSLVFRCLYFIIT